MHSNKKVRDNLALSLRCDADDMLPFPIFDKVEGLEGGDDVVLRDASHLGQVLDGEGPPKINFF
jgi:hypothetical protein